MIDLKDSLLELTDLGTKYNFNAEDRTLLLDRCILLGEACKFLKELGLSEELNERHTKACKKTVELMYK
ncbi:MAG TPA: hypothetical protein VMV43_10095 [Candidatus Nanopelagicaceae bacterium]|nr:hypothetical protein [Candidatus Nanopelagicaceae bacterium]